MNTQTFKNHSGAAGTAPSPSLGKILLGAASGALAGTFLGAAVYHSFVMGLLGTLAGAVGGMIVAAQEEAA